MTNWYAVVAAIIGVLGIWWAIGYLLATKRHNAIQEQLMIQQREPTQMISVGRGSTVSQLGYGAVTTRIQILDLDDAISSFQASGEICVLPKEKSKPKRRIEIETEDGRG